MTRIVIVGICGQMGHALCRAAAESDAFTVAAGIDRLTDASIACPVYGSFDEITEDFDVLIDFSVPAVLESELRYACANNKPAVICTTGLTDAHYAMLKTAAETIPVFNSGNMSIGVNLQMQLLREASAALGAGFDVEIVERHHRRKIDAPSGTALMLANAVNSQRENALEYKYGRSEKNRRRSDSEIGFHSVRGGTIVGEHEVSFIGQDEIIEITHKAFSKRVFAEGALRAAAYLTDKKHGFYDMELMLAEQNAAAVPVSETPAVLLTVSVPQEDAWLSAAAMEALSDADVSTELIACLPVSDAQTGLGMALAASELSNALEALQPLQTKHETLHVQVQGGVSLLSAAECSRADAILPALVKTGIQPLLYTAGRDGICLCVRNSEKETARRILQSID